MPAPRLWLLILLCWLPACSLCRVSVSSDVTRSALHGVERSAWSSPSEVSVISMNVKDMLWLSSHRRARMGLIGTLISALDPDVVCLQEGFVRGDIRLVLDELAEAGLVHVQDYPSGVLGSGLWIVSRYPIHETYFWRYSKNGVFHDTRGGDWWAGKGVALARLELEPGRFLDVYNTHMICSLGPAELHAHRLTQAQELLEFAQRATPPSIPALVVGDFNCGPGSEEFEILESGLGWRSLLEQGSWLDHVQAFSPQATYGFELLEEGRIHGTLQIGKEQISVSDHNGLYVRVRVEPAGWSPTPLPSVQEELGSTEKRLPAPG